MGSKTLFIWLLILVLMLVTTAGCMTSELNAIELVPANANLLGSIQISKIVNDQALRDAYDEAEKEPDMPPGVEEALDEVVEETGIDLRHIAEVVIFSDITAVGMQEYVGIIVEGSFDEERIIDKIGEKMEMDFTVSEYRDYSLYIDRDEEYAATLLSEKMLLLGSTKAVQDTIDVSKGDRERASGVALDTYNRFGDAMIKVAFEVPEETRESMAEEPISDDMPISVESFANMETVGFALSKEMETVTVQIDSHFLSAESAEDASDTISGTISLFKGMLQVPEIKELLDKIEVTATDSWVTIALEITLSEIEELMEVFQETLAGLISPYEGETAETELANIQTAVIAMMVDNGLPTLPNPVIVATNDMGTFPDTSVCGVDKINDYEGNAYVNGQDKDGYVLYGHDLYADASDISVLVNYVTTRYTEGTYTVDALGTVTQVTYEIRY